MSKKIAMIGAGSIVFCKTLMSDLMATPALAGCEFALMSRSEGKLRRMEEFGKERIDAHGEMVPAITHHAERDACVEFRMLEMDELVAEDDLPAVIGLRRVGVFEDHLRALRVICPEPERDREAAAPVG